jgi:hypothetical protein
MDGDYAATEHARAPVTMAIGLSPAFSASVYGITSSASAYAAMQYGIIPVRPFAHSVSRNAI